MLSVKFCYGTKKIDIVLNFKKGKKKKKMNLEKLIENLKNSLNGLTVIQISNLLCDVGFYDIFDQMCEDEINACIENGGVCFTPLKFNNEWLNLEGVIINNKVFNIKLEII